jgi:hypothetical protein
MGALLPLGAGLWLTVGRGMEEHPKASSRPPTVAPQPVGP